MKGSFERFKATPTSLLGTSLNLLAGRSPPMFGALFLLPRSPTTHTSWAPCGWGCRSLLPFLCRELLHRGSHGPCPMGGKGWAHPSGVVRGAFLLTLGSGLLLSTRLLMLWVFILMRGPIVPRESYLNLLWSQKLDLRAVKTLAKATWPEALSLLATWLCWRGVICLPDAVLKKNKTDCLSCNSHTIQFTHLRVQFSGFQSVCGVVQ